MQFDVALVPNHKKHNIKNLYLKEGYFNEINIDFDIFFLLFASSKHINLSFLLSTFSFVKSFNSISFSFFVS
jgi:hypothetical protein